MNKKNQEVGSLGIKTCFELLSEAKMYSGDMLVSLNAQHKLILTRDGNLVFYSNESFREQPNRNTVKK